MVAPHSEERTHANTVGNFLTAFIEEGDHDTALSYAVESLEEPGDAAVAVLALKSLAAKGLGIASLLLAHCALEGRGMATDPVQGLSLLETAAALLSGTSGADARCCLARVLMEEENEGLREVLGVADSEPNPHLVRAFHLLDTSATQSGEALHIFFLARAHLLGIGTPVDPGRGVVALRLSADLGLGVALYDLGECYRKGVGVRKDAKAANAFCKQAKEAGFKGKRKLGDWVNVVHW